MSDSLIHSLPIISIIIPLATSFIVGLFSFKNKKVYSVINIIAIAVSLLCLLCMINPVFIEGNLLVYWLGNRELLGISLEVDSLGLFVGLIISIASLISSIYAYSYMEKDNGLEKYYVLFLILYTSMLGFVFTGDLFNMYVMIEIMTFAAIALTAFRNHKYKSLEAGFKYLVIGGLGSSLILLGTVFIYANIGTLNLAQILIWVQECGGVANNLLLVVALAMLLVGYAVKSFMVPCHTWPTDAHMSAPSSVSMILSGVMSKTGIYGIIRILFVMFGLTGSKGLAILLAIFGVVTMVVGVSMALMQTDFKRLLAFHSVSQIGYIVCGLAIGISNNTPEANLGFVAAIYHMVNHSIFKGLLFLTAGAILYRIGTTNLDKVSGLFKKMPFTTIAFLIGAAGISGIPPFNGFASKWLLYEAGLQSNYAIITAVAFIVSALTLASFIKVSASAFFGPFKAKSDEEKDISESELKEVPIAMKLSMGILSILTLVFGVFPEFIINKILIPVTAAVRDTSSYALAAFKYTDTGSIKAYLGETGFYKPEMFLVIFVLLLIVVFCMVAFNPKQKNFEGSSSKYDSFTCGELDEKAKVGPHDMFWGLKESYKGYFEKLVSSHSGIVNDYVFWIVAALAATLIYTIMFI